MYKKQWKFQIKFESTGAVKSTKLYACLCSKGVVIRCFGDCLCPHHQGWNFQLRPQKAHRRYIFRYRPNTVWQISIRSVHSKGSYGFWGLDFKSRFGHCYVPRHVLSCLVLAWIRQWTSPSCKELHNISKRLMFSELIPNLPCSCFQSLVSHAK